MDMWDQFRHLGPVEHFVIDNSALDPKSTAILVQKLIAASDLSFPGVDL
jgi:hypothetical protein